MTTTNVNINNEIIPAIEEEKTPTVSMEKMLDADIISMPPTPEAPVMQDVPAPTDSDAPFSAAAKKYTAEETAAWIKERDGRIHACTHGGQKLYICSFTSGKAKKAVVVAKSSNDKEPVISNIIELNKEAGQATSALWSLAMSIRWMNEKIKVGEFSLAVDDLLILGTNNNAAAIYAQKAYFGGKVSFSQSSSLSGADRQYVANVSKFIADSIRNIKDTYGCDVSIEALDRNVITSNGHTSSDLYMFRECIATFGDVDIKGTKYHMASVPVMLNNGEKRNSNFFTKFRPTYEGAKGVIRSYKAKNGKTPVEFYVESPYRATMWNLYNGIKEKINK